jgi:hypothetical protein
MPRSSNKNMKGAALILVTGAVRDADDETVYTISIYMYTSFKKN